MSDSSNHPVVPTPERGSAASPIDRLLSDTLQPEEFLLQWTELLVQFLAGDSGAIVRLDAENKPQLLAVYPPMEQGAIPQPWLTSLAPQLSKGLPAEPHYIAPGSGDGMYSSASGGVLIAPLRLGDAPAATVIHHTGAFNPQAALAHVATMGGLLQFYEFRSSAREKLLATDRLRKVVEIQAELQRRKKFLAAAMTLCNELASRFNAERVSLGVLKGRHVHLIALDHSEKFSRKMKLVQQIEQAMEECLDQDSVVVHPADPAAPFVSRDAKELVQHQGSAQVVSLPIRQDGKPKMVLTVEFAAEEPLTTETLEILRLLCELVGPRLFERRQQDRWFGAKWTATSRKGFAWLLGAKKTWLKLLGILILAAVIFAFTAKGDFKIETPLQIEAISQRAVTAPINSYLDSVAVEPGQFVLAGATLAQLDDSELRKQLAAQQAEHNGYLTQAALAQSESKMAEVQIARARAKQVAAKIKLLDYQIARANIVAPISGYVVSEDMSKHVGRAVKAGDSLFSLVAAAPGKDGKPVIALRVVLRVREDDISYLQAGQSGEMVLFAQPATPLVMQVNRIHPVAESVMEQDRRDNTFEVWGVLKSAPPTWLRPGMEGEAEIVVTQKSYAWMFSRRIGNWVRMKLWEWF